MIKKEIKAFAYAIAGIGNFLVEEDHGKVHLFATIVVVVLLFILPTTTIENIIVCFTIALVWVAEMVNSAIEKSLDMITKNDDKRIKYIKDVAAGAVLIASISSVVVGCYILVPKIIQLFN